MSFKLRKVFPALFMALTFACAPGAFAQNEKVLDEIVAVVGDQIILRSEVDGIVYNALQQNEQLSYSEALWQDALGQLIDQAVLVAHARRDTTIAVTDEQVQQALDQRIDQMAAQLGGQSRLEELYGKSIVQIKTDLREDFRKQLMAEQFQSRKMREIRITPSEVESWFERFPTDSLPSLPEVVRVAHIVRYPDVTEEARQEGMEIISTIRDSIVTGTSRFENMALRFSDDLASARLGGRIQDQALDELVPEFAAVASRMPLDSVSQVFESPFGLHILRVNSRRGDVVDFNHVLIKFDESNADPTEAIAYLNTIRDSIVVHGRPFELMARRHSEEVSSVPRGGRVVDPRTGSRDLFLQALGPTWQQAINQIEEGDISEPAEVELLDGRRAYHIVLLQRRVPEHRVNIRTDYERIEQLALQEKQAEMMREWLDSLREEVYVDIRGTAGEFSFARSNG
jgi:peptidyl-prolyl cis-trans isomerase SurA